MPSFSKRSLDNLASCDPRLRRIAELAITHIDFMVIEGHRSVERQKALYAQGRTEKGPIVTNTDGVRKRSQHNVYPSLAFDFVPWPFDGNDKGRDGIGWNNGARFDAVAKELVRAARELGIAEARWGADWNGNGLTSDESLVDRPHFELRR